MALRTQNGWKRWERINWIMPLVKHRALLWQFTVRNFELRHRGSRLGIVWSLLNPLLMLGLYVFIFGYVFGGKNAAQDPRLYALSIFVGLTVFHLVAEVLGVAPVSISGNPGFVKKVVFPLELLPVATVGATFIHVMICLLLTLLGLVLVGNGLTWHTLWMPVILLPELLFALGLAWSLAALGVFFRDIAQLAGFLSMALMFSSAIFYPAASIPNASPFAWSILRFNPVLQTIELSREVLLLQQSPRSEPLLFLYVSGIVSATIGFWIFTRLRPAFADAV